MFEKIKKERLARRKEYLEQKRIRDEAWAAKKAEKEVKRLEREKKAEERKLKKAAW